MIGFILLIFAFILLILGLSSYRKRRQQQRVAALHNKNNTPQVYNGYNPHYNSNPNYGQGYYGQAPPPPPVYNMNPGPMEAGLIQAPPPVYTPYEGGRSGGSSNRGGSTRGKAEYDNPASTSKNGFRNWVRGG